MVDSINIVEKLVDGYRTELVDVFSKMLAIRSIAPESGGQGEGKRADFLEKTLKMWGLPVKRYDYIDERSVQRSNIVSTFGECQRTLWLIAHIDTVSEGERSLWKTEPFEPVVDGDKVYARGANDNGHGIMASMFALKALKESGSKMRYNLGIALVADEEVGSRYGIVKLLDDGIFGKDDMFIVPDSGTNDGSEIEIAEKGILWIKITVIGKQAHASMPDTGKNAYRDLIQFLNEADIFLHSKFNKKDQLFSPSSSTFEMTKHEKNVDSINIIPGMEVSYLDLRILPEYNLDEIIDDIEEIADKYRSERSEIKVEVFNRQNSAPPTKKDSEVVQALWNAVTESREINPKIVGIGGGTCAFFFRERGMPTVVWSTQDPTIDHQPNEWASLTNILKDAKTFLRIVCID